MKKGQEWSEYQIKYLIEHYPNERSEDVGKIIGKSSNSVQHKAHMLKIRKDRNGFFEIRSKLKSGENCWNFKNYRRRTPKGYITVYKPDHPNASKHGLIMEHRLVMEEHLGMIIPKGFTVHHINGIKDDNRIENLALMTNSAHSILHNKESGKQKKGKDNPLYIDIDPNRIIELRESGLSVNEICEELKIGRTKYYSVMRGA